MRELQLCPSARGHIDHSCGVLITSLESRLPSPDANTPLLCCSLSVSSAQDRALEPPPPRSALSAFLWSLSAITEYMTELKTGESDVELEPLAIPLKETKISLNQK